MPGYTRPIQTFTNLTINCAPQPRPCMAVPFDRRVPWDAKPLSYPRLNTANAPPAVTNKLPIPRLAQRICAGSFNIINTFAAKAV